jgi:hypothetical protein
MPDPDYKTLCAELVYLNDVEVDGWVHKWADVIRRTKAALAQPEPVAPTDEELVEVASNPLGYVHIRVDSKELEANGEELIAFARAVLARWGTPANTINQEANR